MLPIPQKIAIVGSGISGLSAAYYLSKTFDVTLFEAGPIIGGHSNTVALSSGPDAGLRIDTGFIVCNRQNYPNFCRFLSHLGVDLIPSDMSFSFYQAKSATSSLLYYSSDFPSGVFAQKKNLVSPSFLGLLAQMFRFNRNSILDLEAGRLSGLTLQQYLDHGGYSSFFRDHYLLPMGAAIWSASFSQMNAFPAQTFVQFWKNHGLLQVSGRPQWQTVSGGSRTYVDAVLKTIPGRYHVNSPVRSIYRHEDAVTLEFKGRPAETFDAVVIATHADQAYRLLGDPSPLETQLLSPWSYSQNRTVLHTDLRLMPPNRSVWASWNYLQPPHGCSDGPLTLTYYMNRLQSFSTETPYLVTLNPNSSFSIDPDKIIAEFEYTHPIFNFESLNTQPTLGQLNGQKRTYFCGSYFGYGFHEDGITSALAVVSALGGDSNNAV